MWMATRQSRRKRHVHGMTLPSGFDMSRRELRNRTHRTMVSFLQSLTLLTMATGLLAQEPPGSTINIATLEIILSTTPAEGTKEGSGVEPHKCLQAWQYRISAGVHSSALSDGSTQQVPGGCEAITAYAQSLVNVWSEADIDLNRIPLDQCNP